MRPLVAAVLDLDAALGGNAGLMLAGGLGIYLKQVQLQESGARTLVPHDLLPPARTTQDVDLVLRAEVVASPTSARTIRSALDSLGFQAVAGAEFLKFRRGMPPQEVAVDLLVGPLGAHRSAIDIKGGRARPAGLSGRDSIHARHAPEALGVDVHWCTLTVAGVRSDGMRIACPVRTPSPFTYALMKLAALQDRIHDAGKGHGRHHAVDLYRIVAMLTEEDAHLSQECAREHRNDDTMRWARGAVEELFGTRDGLGRLRLLEGLRSTAGFTHADADLLHEELHRLLA